MRINGLIQSMDAMHENLSKVVLSASNSHDLSSSNLAVTRIHQEITEIVSRVERLCKKHQASPADLPNPSYRAYQWFKFLSHKKWLLAHLHAIQDFQGLSQDLINFKRVLVPKLEIKIAHSTYLFRVNQNGRKINFEINEGFITAPHEIKKKLVQAALDRKNRQHARSIRAYTRTEAYIEISAALNSSSQRNHRSYKGKHFDLLELFDQLNRAYFSGKLEQPRLMWSARRSKRRLGYYDPHSNTITINRRFDEPNTPRLLIEYILFHEMLHQHLGIREINGRRYAHTSIFKRAEKRFNEYKAAEELIKSLNK